MEVVTEPLVNSEEMLAKLWCFTQKKNQLSDSWFFYSMKNKSGLYECSGVKKGGRKTSLLHLHF